jgi:hypothetical protein
MNCSFHAMMMMKRSRSLSAGKIGVLNSALTGFLLSRLASRKVFVTTKFSISGNLLRLSADLLVYLREFVVARVIVIGFAGKVNFM